MQRHEKTEAVAFAFTVTVAIGGVLMFMWLIVDWMQSLGH